MNSIDKRNSVKEDYNLIANQYCKEFETILEDIDLINKFESYLGKDSSIIDLGGGSGKLTNYFNEKGYNAICYDFSENMKEYAEKTYPNIKYILDDIININNHFNESSIDGIIAMYSLFHIPKENINQLFKDINSVLKDNGLFCFSLQIGSGEAFVDEPYLKENGKKILYMNYLNKREIYDLLDESNFDIIYETEKHETGENVIGENGNDATYIISRKRVVTKHN